jgi:predicted secreted protein
MGVMNFILTITMIWMVLIFISFPIGLKMPEKIEKGHADSAPEKHYLIQKIVITFVLSIVITFIYWYIVYG